MTKKNLKKRYWKATKARTSRDLTSNWWNWEDRESNYDLSAHATQALGNDIPFSQMDEIQEPGGH